MYGLQEIKLLPVEEMDIREDIKVVVEELSKILQEENKEKVKERMKKLITVADRCVDAAEKKLTTSYEDNLCRSFFKVYKLIIKQWNR